MHGAFSDFLHKVESARDELRCSRSGAYFRGHSNANHFLLPSLLRNKITNDVEHNLYSECFARARRLMPQNINSWEFLSHMQHYGIPTRLLDWTDSLAAALFFALHSTDTDRPCIWVLNGFTLNKYSGVSPKPEIIVPGIDPIVDYFSCFVLHEDQGKKLWNYEKPIFLDIPWVSDRISAQRGYFTFHSSAEPMEQECADYVRKIEITAAAIPGATRFLESAGVNEYSIYPDLEGLAKHLRKVYTE